MNITVKVKFGIDLRRFSVKSDVQLQNFRSLVADLYHLPNFILKYQDDEGDSVNIKTDTDLREAIRLALLSPSLILRLEVHPATPKSLEDSTWIVVPDETTKTPEFPSIFGFQIPQLESNSNEIKEIEEAMNHFVLVDSESKPPTNPDSCDEKIEYTPIQEVVVTEEKLPEKLSEKLPQTLSDNVLPLNEKFPETLPELVLNESETQLSTQQMSQPVQKNSTTSIENPSLPTKRLSELCSDLSSEIKSSCLFLSNETLQDMVPCWKSTVSDCLANSLLVRNQCLTEVEATRDLMRNVPSGVAQSSNIISAATTVNCNLAASSVIFDCQSSKSDVANSDLANLQLSELSRECKELAASIRASIMAM